MARRAIILVAEIEVDEFETAEGNLDKFRTAVLPQDYGITLYRPVSSVLGSLIREGGMTVEGSLVED